MINIAQTLEYVQLCSMIGESPTPRTAAEVSDLFIGRGHGDEITKRAAKLTMYPETAEAYMELIRVQVSLRALGELDIHHPCAMINISNFAQMLNSVKKPKDVVEAAAPYNIGNLSLYGSLLLIARDLYKQLERNGNLGRVFQNSNLARLISLYEYLDNNMASELIDEIVNPVNVPHIKHH